MAYVYRDTRGQAIGPITKPMSTKPESSADGKPHHSKLAGKGQFWLNNHATLKPSDLHVTDVTKPETNPERQLLACVRLAQKIHLDRQPLLNTRKRCEQLAEKDGVYFVKTQIVDEVNGPVGTERCLQQNSQS